ncbi:MAG: hypothetical protein K1W13_03675 [Lachnospiraceae bacterium]
MSRKQELTNILNEYQRGYTELLRQVTEIRNSSAYTAVGREQAVSKLEDDFSPTVKRCHDSAAGLVESALAAMSEKWKKGNAKRIQDAGYQAGLANAIKMLELGAVREQEDIQGIIDSFAGDFNALSVIRKILENSNDEEIAQYSSLVSKDNREYCRRLLGQLKNNIDRDINMQAVHDNLFAEYNQPLGGILLGIDGMLQFVTERLDDNLELLA